MPRSRHALRALAAFAFVLALGLALAARAAASSKRAPTDDLDTRVEATLARHLDGPRIGAWLETLPAGSLEDEAARWILAWLPLSDCAALDLPLLREHVEWAAAAYRESPWREQLPRELWLRFVVPHRVSQEPAQAWRASFAAALAPRIAGAPSMESAALAVNRWCREQATYTPSSGRDLGPLSTIARGLGRCEEETILTVCALRAAGLPARSCATPYWTFTDSNHAWVEVWTDGAWHYLGGCEPERCLDRAWFTGAARRAGFVRSAAYGEFDPAPEPLYRREQGVTLINSTPVYGTPIRLRAALDPALAVPTPRELTVNVLNFGSMRPLAKVPDGGEIAIGPGEYALTAGDDSTLYLRVVGGAGGERLAVTLGAADHYDLDAAPGFWLRYPEDEAPPARDLDLVSDAEDAALARGIAARDADRAKLREASPTERARLDSLPAAQARRIATILDEKPHTRASLFVALLDAAADSLAREDLLAVLEAMDDKDLLELDETAIAGELALAQAQRTRLAAVGLAVPDSIWRARRAPQPHRPRGGQRLARGAPLASARRRRGRQPGRAARRLPRPRAARRGRLSRQSTRPGPVLGLRAGHGGGPRRLPGRPAQAQRLAGAPALRRLRGLAGRLAGPGSEGSRAPRCGRRGGSGPGPARARRHARRAAGFAGRILSALQRGAAEGRGLPEPLVGTHPRRAGLGRGGLHLQHGQPRAWRQQLRPPEALSASSPAHSPGTSLPLEIGPGWSLGESAFTGPAPAAIESALAAAGLPASEQSALSALSRG